MPTAGGSGKAGVDVQAQGVTQAGGKKSALMKQLRYKAVRQKTPSSP
jgi:hypothetical protein